MVSRGVKIFLWRTISLYSQTVLLWLCSTFYVKTGKMEFRATSPLPSSNILLIGVENKWSHRDAEGPNTLSRTYTCESTVFLMMFSKIPECTLSHQNHRITYIWFLQYDSREVIHQSLFYMLTVYQNILSTGLSLLVNCFR